MNKETVLWLLIGASSIQGFINLYFNTGERSGMLFIGLSAFFLGLLCITPNKTLEEDLIDVVK